MKEKIHIGKLIRQKMEKDGRTTKWLAKQIGCHPSLVSRIYGQQYPETGRLIKICIHLKINLFIHYFDYVNKRLQEESNTT